MVHYCKWISWAISDDKYYVVDERTNRLFVLRGVSALIWRLLGTSTDINEIKRNICQKFDDVVPSVINSDIDEFLAELVKDGLIEYE